MLPEVGTRQTRLERGRERARELRAISLTELRNARITAGSSQRALARLLGWSQSRYSEWERNLIDPALSEICEVASLLGLRPGLSFHPIGDPLRDAGQSRLVARFLALLSPLWHVALEAPFPTLGDLRSWDVFLRLASPAHRTGVEAETRIRDQQELVRRIRQRELHGGAETILIVLSDSTHNRANVGALRNALGPKFQAQPRAILAALRLAVPLPGSGVILL
jgi:transcriptional regulator with XRE-family HTH domain